jgi:hypothetical protein
MTGGFAFVGSSNTNVSIIKIFSREIGLRMLSGNEISFCIDQDPIGGKEGSNKNFIFRNSSSFSNKINWFKALFRF